MREAMYPAPASLLSIFARAKVYLVIIVKSRAESEDPTRVCSL
jgi:hypothetical protein